MSYVYVVCWILLQTFQTFLAYSQTVWTLIRLLLQEQSDLGPHCLQKWLLKSQTNDKADDSCFDWLIRVNIKYISLVSLLISFFSKFRTMESKYLRNLGAT